MKKKFLSLILAISMLPAPIASYAEDDNKCKKELELCMATKKDLFDELNKCNYNLTSVVSTTNYFKKCTEDALYTSKECLDVVKDSSKELFLYRMLLLLIFTGMLSKSTRNLIVRFVQKFND